jgi:4-hydroxybenzoate polyprenyltransferase/phosphoserine phosphatase
MLTDTTVDTDAAACAERRLPLVVDLDGTLIRTDLLIETAFARLGQDPLAFWAMVRVLPSGKAALKHLLAANADLKPELLPYDHAVLEKIHEAKSAGRKVHLASASHERLVSAIAQHLGLFDGVFASDAASNLSGQTKADRLVRAFGEGGFDYIGNDRADIPVWKKAAARIAIRAPRRVVVQLRGLDGGLEELPSANPGLRTWARLLRVYQYSKNGLIFVPIVTAQAFHPASLLAALLAFVAFSLCASCVYIVNDVVDLQADRMHPTKNRRPLASGQIAISSALIVAATLLAVGIAVAALISIKFVGVLALYLALTTAYSFFLKRKLLVDIVALASLYSIRVVGGAVAIDVPVSQWLLAFSLFIFTALALIKRYAELATRVDTGMPDPGNRNYRLGDLSVIAALAAAAGFNAVTVFTLYISSDAVRVLYSKPELLWLFCPLLMYWIGRILVLAHRRVLDDDPIVFALRDRVSYLALAVAAAIILAAK